MIRNNYYVYIILILFTSLLTSACENRKKRRGKSLPFSQTINQGQITATNVIIYDHVKSLDTMINLESISQSDDQIMINTQQAGELDLEVDDIIASDAGDGFLRRILSISTSEMGLEIETEVALLTDAVQSADITLRFEAPEEILNPNPRDEEAELESQENPIKATSNTNLSPKLDRQQFKMTETPNRFFDEKNRVIKKALIESTLWVEGSLSTTLNFTFDMSIREGKLISAKTNFHGGVSGFLALGMTKSLTISREMEYELLSLPKVSVRGMIGWLPVIISLKPSLQFNWTSSFKTTLDLFTAKVDFASALDAELTYYDDDDEWRIEYESTPPSLDLSTSLDGPELGISLNNTFALIPQLNIQFYESAGVQLDTPLSLSSTISLAEADCLNFKTELVSSIDVTPKTRWDALWGIEPSMITVFEKKLLSASEDICLPEPKLDMMMSDEQNLIELSDMIIDYSDDMGINDSDDRTEESLPNDMGEPIGEEQRCQASLSGVTNLECAKWFGSSDSTNGTIFMFGLGQNLTQTNIFSNMVILELESGTYFDTQGQHMVSAYITEDTSILDQDFISGECQIRLNTTLPRTSLPNLPAAAMVDLDINCILDDGSTNYDLSIQASDYPVQFQ